MKKIFFSLISLLIFSSIFTLRVSAREFEDSSNNFEIQPRWYIHGETIINATETYSFETESGYNMNNPDFRAVTPMYSNINGEYNQINESLFRVSAFDSTNQEQVLNCTSSFMNFGNIFSNGKAYVKIQYYGDDHLPNHCEISEDTMTLNSADTLFRLKSNEDVSIYKGIVLHRQSSTGVFNGWDNYVMLEQFINDSSLRIAFDENMYVQVAILYEIHNYDDGWWIFQKHAHYRVMGIYNFRTGN